VAERLYWSARLGRGPRGNPTIEDVGRALTLAVQEMGQRDYLQEWYGYSCVDAGDVPGEAGVDIATHVTTVLGHSDGWPLPTPLVDFPEGVSVSEQDVERATEDAECRVFDLIEFFHDHVSKGTDGYFHHYCQCGWHYSKFDARPAQELFRTRINAVLRSYKTGYRLTALGEIEHAAPPGLEGLLDAPLRTEDVDIKQRVDAAIAKYKHRDRTQTEQRDAVRNLFDVLEKLRPQVKQNMLKGDERDLFNIANNFCIRHLNESQRRNYDSPLWLSWMFYVNLATIHLVTRLTQRPLVKVGATRS
jgi:hypothetical protein